MKYTETTNELGTTLILRENEDSSITIIPKELANSDYQQYLRWLNGEPEPIPGGNNQ